MNALKAFVHDLETFKRKYRAPEYAFNALKTSTVLLQLYCAHESPGELVKMQSLIQYIRAEILQV